MEKKDSPGIIKISNSVVTTNNGSMPKIEMHPQIPEKLLWNLLEAIPLNISIWKEGKLYFANPGFYKALSINPGDFEALKKATDSDDYFTVHPDDYGVIKKNVLDIKDELYDGKAYHCEIRMRAKIDEDYKWYNTYVVKGKNGQSDITIEISEEITEKKLMVDRLNEALREKDILLKEIHHRVKNNFQIISSLLRMQQKKLKDQDTKDILIESESRVRSMAMIHESLYKTADLANISYGKHIRHLTRNFVEAYSGRANLVKFNIEASDCIVGVDIAIPCSLIINEIITNSFKHGLDDSRVPEIDIKFEKKDDKYTLFLKDNGVGFPDSFEHRKSDSLGIMLVETLVRQLNGSIVYRNNDGAEVIINFSEQ